MAGRYTTAFAAEATARALRIVRIESITKGASMYDVTTDQEIGVQISRVYVAVHWALHPTA